MPSAAENARPCRETALPLERGVVRRQAVDDDLWTLSVRVTFGKRPLYTPGEEARRRLWALVFDRLV